MLVVAQSALADSFLDDLDDLDSGSDADAGAHTGTPGESTSQPVQATNATNSADAGLSGDDASGAHGQEQREEQGNQGEGASGAAGIASVATLRRSEGFMRHMARVRRMLGEADATACCITDAEDEGDAGYQLVCDCNSLTRIDEELGTIFRSVADTYAHKFPELNSSCQTAQTTVA